MDNHSPALGYLGRYTSLAMSLIKRKKSLRPILLEIVLTPFIMIFVMVVVFRYLLVIGLCLMLFSMWMAGEPFIELVPDKETLYVLLGCIGLIYIAAIPLGMIDYLSDGGYKTIWEPTPDCLDAAMAHVGKLISGDFNSFYSLFSPKLQSDITEHDLVDVINHLKNEIGPFVSLLESEEIELSEDVLSDPDYVPASDCIVHVLMQHSSQKKSFLILYLNSQESFQIENIHILKY